MEGLGNMEGAGVYTDLSEEEVLDVLLALDDLLAVILHLLVVRRVRIYLLLKQLVLLQKTLSLKERGEILSN